MFASANSAIQRQLRNVAWKGREPRFKIDQKQYITLLNNSLQNLAFSISNGNLKPSSVLKSTENARAIAQGEPQVYV